MPFTTIQESGTKVIIDAGNATIQGAHPKVADFTKTLSANSVPLTTTQVNALNNFYVGLVANGLDTKMIAIYPFIGTTATSNKFNLMDARDLDAAYRLSFLGGGWTYDANGSTPNGTSSYADTFINISTLGNWETSNHLSIYSPTTTSNAAWNIAAGSNGMTGANIFGLGLRTIPVYDSGSGVTNRASGGSGGGCWIGSTTGNNLRRIYKNGQPIASSTTINSQLAPNLNLYIGRGNTPGYTTIFMPNNFRFITVGRTLTDSEVFILNSLIQQYQTTLGRAV